MIDEIPIEENNYNSSSLFYLTGEPGLYENEDDNSSSGILPTDFVPGKWDVICQRGKECYEHVGNRRFRMCIESHFDDYIKLKSRQEKSSVVATIVQSILVAARESGDGAGFVRKDLITRRWYKVGDKLAREKVGQALRDTMKKQKTTPSFSKGGKRQAFQAIKAKQQQVLAAGDGSSTMVEHERKPALRLLPTIFQHDDQAQTNNTVCDYLPAQQEKVAQVISLQVRNIPRMVEEEAFSRMTMPENVTSSSSSWSGFDESRATPSLLHLPQQQQGKQHSCSSSNNNITRNCSFLGDNQLFMMAGAFEPTPIHYMHRHHSSKSIPSSSSSSQHLLHQHDFFDLDNASMFQLLPR